MRSLFKNRVFILVLSTLLIIAVIAISAMPGSPLSFVTKPLSVVIDPVQSVFRSIGTKISDFYSAIAEGMEIRKENEELRAEIAELEYKSSFNAKGDTYNEEFSVGLLPLVV